MSTVLMDLNGKNVVVSGKYFEVGSIVEVSGTKAKIVTCRALPNVYKGWIYSIEEV